jgi:cytochrome c-type biogenesis protein CcmH
MAAAAPAPAATSAPAAAPPGPGMVSVRVRVSPALAAKVPAGAPLFVLARDPTQPGPPFGAKRIADAALPLEVRLTEQDAMMPVRTIKTAKQLVIVARYSLSGMPSAASGDLYGEVPYDLKSGRLVELVIDKQVP